jgi:hypothetical protein
MSMNSEACLEPSINYRRWVTFRFSFMRLPLHMHLYVPDFYWQVGLSYLICRRFYEGAQAQAH